MSRIINNRTVLPTQCLTQNNARLECPVCSKLIGVCRYLPVDKDVDSSSKLIREAIAYCDHCDHIIRWEQPVDAEGSPVYALGIKHSLIRDQKRIEKLLIFAPELRGVADVVC